MKDMTTGLMDGKNGIIFGVANDRSLAWHIAERLHEEGATLAFTHLPPPKMERRVRLLAEPIESPCIVPCDLTDDAQIKAAFREANRKMGHLGLRGPLRGLRQPGRPSATRTTRPARADFLQALEISAYSLVALCQPRLCPTSTSAPVS